MVVLIIVYEVFDIKYKQLSSSSTLHKRTISLYNYQYAQVLINHISKYFPSKIVLYNELQTLYIKHKHEKSICLCVSASKAPVYCKFLIYTYINAENLPWNMLNIRSPAQYAGHKNLPAPFMRTEILTNA